MRIVIAIVLALFSLHEMDASDTCCNDSVTLSADTLTAPTDSVTKKKPNFLKRSLKWVGKAFNHLNAIDTNYIEPQQFPMTVMALSTYTYETYTLTSKDGQSISFGPSGAFKVGPYFGWSVIFLGYTVGFSQISIDTKKVISLSLYTPALGFDFFYRRTGGNYRIRGSDFGDKVDTRPIEDVPFDGLKVAITGFNIYYIVNHKRFSSPAAFSQSTCQLKSCGSPIFGIGYTRHSLALDYEALKQLVKERMPEQTLSEDLDFNEVKYTDFSLQGGYAYNYVFAKNLLASASLQLALGYKHSWSDGKGKNIGRIFKDFSFSNFNIDGVGRMAVVWNTSRWYAGTSAIMHLYNYSKSQFSTRNMFGEVNLYVGLNFGKRKKKK